MSPKTINRQSDRRAITLWLLLCALLIAGMVMLGGYTRLSGSGLSITEWNPIHGTIPPLSAAQWQEEFAAYQQSPQYKLVNSGMTLDQFKVIFWPEFLHRLLGRAIGLVFFLPLIVFALRRSLSWRFFGRLVIIFALGGLQGLIGWLMVKSGLINDPHVSAWRLALHLSTAFLIYTLILWAAMDVSARGMRQEAMVKKHTLAHCPLPLALYLLWFIALCLQIILGALMAGLHAGLVYNTWPSMNGQFLPDGLLADPVTFVQFLHRNMAVLVAAGFIFWWYFSAGYVRDRHLGKVCAGATALIAIQFALGVTTLLHQVPLNLALAHQTCALLLFTVAVVLLHGLSPPNGGVRYESRLR